MNVKRTLSAAVVAVSLVGLTPLHADAKTITKKVCTTVKGKKSCRFVKVNVPAKKGVAKAADTTVVKTTKAADTTVVKTTKAADTTVVKK